MSDAPAEAVPTDAAPSTPPPSVDGAGTSPTDTAPVDTAPTETSELDREIPGGVKTFDREYVERLRGEAGNYRTRLREAEQQAQERAAQLEQYAAFEGYSPEDMQVWTSMASAWKSGDYTTAANTMMEIAKNVLGDPGATREEKADAQAVLDDPEINAAADAAEGMTPEQIREMVREENQNLTAEQEREKAVEQVFAQIREAGYEEGSPEMNQVLWFATQKTGGDIAEAIKLHKEREQSIIDNYVKSIAKGGSPVRLPSAGSPATESQPEPTNLAEARRAADAWLKERQAQQ